MMALVSGGSVAGGNSSSSTSNLSASAPPFTVDRFNPKPISNPVFGYPESGYAVEPFTHGWQYAPPSAPRPELVIDSTGISSLSVSDVNRFPNSGSVSPSNAHWSVLSPGVETLGSSSPFGGEVNPYYSPYVPASVGETNQLVDVDGPPYSVVPASGISTPYQTNSSQSFFDWDFVPGRVDGLGFNDGKGGTRVEPGGIFSSEKSNVGGSHSYKDQLKRGGHGMEYLNKSCIDSGLSYENFNHTFDGVVHNGSLSVSHKEDSSCLEKNLSFTPYESYATTNLASSSTYPDSHPLGLSCDMQPSFSKYQIPFQPYEKHVDSTFRDPRSSKKSSPAVVIRPPPSATSNVQQGAIFSKPSRSDNVVGVPVLDLDRSYSQIPKDRGLKQTPDIREDPFDASLLDFSKQSNGQFFLSASLEKELSSPLHDKDTFDDKINESFGSQSPDTHLSGVFALSSDSVRVGKSVEDSSDLTDHHSTAVDSPCWRGAPFPHFSLVDIEDNNSNPFEKKFGENYGLNLKTQENNSSLADSTRTPLEKSNKDDGNEGRKSVALTISPNRDHSISNDMKTGFRFSSVTSHQGVHIGNGLNMPGKGSDSAESLKNGFDMKISDTQHFGSEKDINMTFNDAAEEGDIAVHAAEKVLASPPSQEDAIGHGKQQGELKLDGSTMIKAMHNLSSLLLSHLSNNPASLEDDDTETLRNIISNINACMSYSINRSINRLEAKYPAGNASEKLGESCDLFATSVSPQKYSHVRLDYLRMHEQKRQYSFSGETAENSPDCSPLTDESDIMGHVGMVKDIKKVLEENFRLTEVTHPQSLLFKSLWLEAEAKLCSISYKTRFDLLKIEMEKKKLRAPQEDVDVAKLMPKICISPDPDKVPNPVSEAHDDTVPEHVIIRTDRYVNDAEASIMARYNILKSREENIAPTSMEEEQSLEVGGGVPDSIASRFNILKSREENLTPINTQVEQQPEMVECFTDSVMSRFNILKSREDNLKFIRNEGEPQSQIADDESAGKRKHVPCIKDQTEDETVKLSLKPYFMHQAGSSELCSFADGSGYESLKERASVPKDPMILSFDKSKMVNEPYARWPSSDWEHVQKDDLLWKKF